MFTLPQRKIMVKPVVWEGWLDKGHSGVWLNDGAVMIVTVPTSRATGELIDPLTPEEREFFENKAKSGMDFAPGDLSPYKKPDERTGYRPFWYEKEVVIRKPDTIITSDTVLTTFDLSKPTDYLNYKVLLANSGIGGIVATSWETRFDQGTHRLVLVEEGYDAATKSRTAAEKIEAYGLLSKISKSQTKLYEFLSVYWLENRNAVKPSVDQKIDSLLADVEKIITENPREFIRLMNEDYDDKLVIHNGIRLGIIKLIGNTFVLNPDETPVGSSLKEVILYFKDDRHQEDKMKLLAQINSDK